MDPHDGPPAFACYGATRRVVDTADAILSKNLAWGNAKDVISYQLSVISYAVL
jgi:hypothetical protein